MKTKITIIFFTILVPALLLSACSGSAFSLSSWAGVTVADGTVYVAFDKQVYAIQAQNGIEKWHFPAKPDPKKTFFAAPSLTEDGQLIVGGYDNQIYSLNISDGTILWESGISTKRIIGSSLISDGLIHVPSSDFTLYTFKTNGDFLWSYQAGAGLWAKPTTDGNTIYIPSMNHHIYAVDKVTGKEIWTKDVGGATVGTPAIDQDGHLYVGTFGSKLTSFDSANGKTFWTFDAENWIWAAPVVFQERVFIGDLSGNVYSLDKRNGKTVWNLKTDGPITGTPLLISDRIYIGTETGSIYAVDLDGTVLWKKTIAGKLYAPLADAGDFILAAPVESESLLIAFDKDGSQQWTYQIQK